MDSAKNESKVLSRSKANDSEGDSSGESRTEHELQTEKRLGVPVKETPNNNDVDPGKPCTCKHNETEKAPKKSVACRRVFLLGGIQYMERKVVTRIQNMQTVVSNEQPLPVEPIDNRSRLRGYACPKSIRPVWKSDEIVSWLTILFILFSIVLYIGNVLSNVAMAYFLFRNGHYWWFAGSVVFSLASILIVNFCSYLWYVKEEGLCGYLKPNTFSRTPFKRRIYRFATHAFLTSIIFRQVDTLWYAFRFRRELRMLPRSCGNETYYIYTRERRDTALLSLIESFFRDIPQFTLQLSIWILVNVKQSTIQCDLFCFVQYVSLAVSIVSFSCAMVNFQHSLRASRKRKKQLSCAACFLQFVWRLGTTGSRIFAIILLMNTYPNYVFIIILLHWGLMSSWILNWKADVAECPRQNYRSWKICLDRSYACLLGAIYLFCFLNTTRRRSSRKIKKYYSLIAAEDTLFVLLWYVKVGNEPALPGGFRPWIFGWVGFMYYFPFITGVVAMIVYYKKCHPTTNGKKETLDIQYFDSNLDLVVLKNWRKDQEDARTKPSTSASDESVTSFTSDQSYATIQQFYTASYHNPAALQQYVPKVARSP